MFTRFKVMKEGGKWVVKRRRLFFRWKTIATCKSFGDAARFAIKLMEK